LLLLALAVLAFALFLFALFLFVFLLLFGLLVEGLFLFLFFGRLLGLVARFAEEFLHRVVDFVRVGGDGGRGEDGREVDLLDFGTLQFVEQIEQFDQFGAFVDVGGRVFGQDVDQVVVVGDQVERRDLVAHLAEEALLTGRADDVGVRMS